MKYALVAIAAIGLGLVTGACKSSHEEGVKSNYMEQWTDVNANVETTTDAAKSVLETEGLKDVSASATKVDGKATAKKADGTKVTAAVKKLTDTSSQLSVSVGTMGDPKWGAQLAKEIKTKAETK
jgi:Zn-dependent membrane protease YugP